MRPCFAEAKASLKLPPNPSTITLLRHYDTVTHSRLEDFTAECDKRENADFRGYARVFKAILERNSAEANAGFVDLLKGNRRQCKGNGVFRFTEHEDLCIWGLGLANLAKSYGLMIQIDDPLIPAELLV